MIWVENALRENKKITDYKINIHKKDSFELFFVKGKLETLRCTDTCDKKMKQDVKAADKKVKSDVKAADKKVKKEVKKGEKMTKAQRDEKIKAAHSAKSKKATSDKKVKK